MRSTILATLLASTTSIIAGSALAGGYTAPVQPPVIVAPIVEETVVGDWAGGYVGASIGYSFGGDDEIGFDYYNNNAHSGRETKLGSADVKGVTGALQLGYRWQRNNWVYGPELSYEGGSVDAEEDIVADGDAATLTSEVNSIISLRFKTGYLVNPQTLVYGTVGVTHGDFDYTLASGDDKITEGYTRSGWSAGLGAERLINDRWSMFAEWEYRDFGKEDVQFGTDATYAETRATPEHHNIRVGVNYRF